MTSACSTPAAAPALRPGGRLVAQCGGEGNVAEIEAAIARVDEPALAGWAGPWNFASPAATERRLAAAGFSGIWTWRQHVRVEPDDPHEYFATIMLGWHLERIEPERRAGFVDEVLANLIEVSPARRVASDSPSATLRPSANYVRLNILARRPT